MLSSGASALGIDVGASRKGFDIVLLDKSRVVLRKSSRVSPERLSELLREWQPDVIAIDSPSAWAAGKERLTEGLVRALGIHLYQTPWEETKKSHPFYAWMGNGFEAFNVAIGCGYRLFDGDRSVDGHCFEVFPYASAVILSGGLRPTQTGMAAWRRSVLASAGVDVTTLRGPDQVDAALAAVTGLFALAGEFTFLGNPTEGVIILPCSAANLRDRYRAGNAESRTDPSRINSVKRGFYPDRLVRRLTEDEKAEIRRRLTLGGTSSFEIAEQLGLGVVQVAGIKAAMTLRGRRTP